MGNPYKDAEKNKPRVIPGGEQKTHTQEEVVEEKVVAEKPPVQENLLAGMIEQKPEGKSYGFYLSIEAMEKLEKLAKQNKCSKSKALDTLLRSLL